MFEVDVKVRSTVVPGSRLVLLAILSVMASIAYTPATAMAVPGGAGQVESGTGGRAFDRQGMWIWYVSQSEGGSIPRIVARARSSGVGTVYVKSGDGGDYWGQFSRALVKGLHAGGLDVCAWQFVYGEHPRAEALAAAAAVRRGADCFAIDAEAHYEGRYAAADRYVRALRARIGPSFPVSLASFPYVDYHPSFPYSVFFGPGGATYNQPQMYWKAIGTSVRGVYEHTYLFNRLWGHPIYPLGQTYGGASSRGVMRFRRFAESYHGLEPSWWSWQETNGGHWRALGATVVRPVFGYQPLAAHPLLKRGSKGDLVVWAQQHLRAAGQAQLPVTGFFGPLTRAAVRDFQSQRGLFADGRIGLETWQALLDFEPVRTRWAARSSAGRRGASASRALPPRRPLSASLPAKAYEIDPGPAP